MKSEHELQQLNIGISLVSQIERLEAELNYQGGTGNPMLTAPPRISQLRKYIPLIEKTLIQPVVGKPE